MHCILLHNNAVVLFSLLFCATCSWIITAPISIKRLDLFRCLLLFSTHTSKKENFQVKVSSLRTYSPISAWWKHIIFIGSDLRHSPVDFAATPNPWQNNKTLSCDTYTQLFMYGSDLPGACHSLNTLQRLGTWECFLLFFLIRFYEHGFRIKTIVLHSV